MRLVSWSKWWRTTSILVSFFGPVRGPKIPYDFETFLLNKILRRSHLKIFHHFWLNLPVILLLLFCANSSNFYFLLLFFIFDFTLIKHLDQWESTQCKQTLSSNKMPSLIAVSRFWELELSVPVTLVTCDCVQEVVKAHHEGGHEIWWNLKSRFIYPIGHQLWYFGQWVPKKWSILGISCFSQIWSLFSKNGRNSLTVWPNFKFRTILETRTIAGSRKICLSWLFECIWSPEPSEAVDVGSNTQKPPSQSLLRFFP